MDGCLIPESYTVCYSEWSVCSTDPETCCGRSFLAAQGSLPSGHEVTGLGRSEWLGHSACPFMGPISCATICSGDLHRQQQQIIPSSMAKMAGASLLGSLAVQRRLLSRALLFSFHRGVGGSLATTIHGPLFGGWRALAAQAVPRQVRWKDCLPPVIYSEAPGLLLALPSWLGRCPSKAPIQHHSPGPANGWVL